MRSLITILFAIIFFSSAMISVAQAEKKIIINLASRMLSLYDNNNRIGLFPLGVGKVSTPTPTGYYKILTKEINPPWIDPNDPEHEVPSGSSNPLGYRWMQIQGNYGIHGTNRPESIGGYVSNGCIRMREADVEQLFDNVEIGTPVEITYNRVVVEKSADDRIALYIYPDGYGWQALDVKYVNSWLESWGISAFAEDKEIAEAISRSDGEPVYIAKAYSLLIDDKTVPATEQNKRHFDNKVVERGGITYLPAVPIAIAMNMKLEWRHHSTLATKFGEVPGIEKKGQLYLNEDDAGLLFNVNTWREGNVYKLKKISPEEEKFDVTKIEVDPNSPKEDSQSKIDEEKKSDENLKDDSKQIENKVDEKKSVEDKNSVEENIDEKESVNDKKSVKEKVEDKKSDKDKNKSSKKKSKKKNSEVDV